MTQHSSSDEALNTQRTVHKFGGSSLADAAGFQRVADIIHSEGQADSLVVVSASGKTTNRLIELLNLFDSGDSAAATTLEGVYSYQQTLIATTLPEAQAGLLQELLDTDINTIAHVLESQRLDDFQRNFIQAFGEQWSARLLSALLSSQGLASSPLDARDFLRVSGSPVQIDDASSRQLLAAILSERRHQVLVVTGFIAGDDQGRTRLLGRNGSDFSATLLASLADSSDTTIWSDVSGV